MGNACRPFGFDNDDGMRIFTIVEMFLACYHIITASYVYKHMFQKFHEKGGGTNDYEHAVLVMGFFFVIFLVLQAIAGFLLYLKGWKEKNATICYTWIAFAIINLTLSLVIGVVGLISGSEEILWNRFFLYLFYVCYGVWVVRSFTRWAKEQGFQTFNVCCCTWDQLMRRNFPTNDPELGSTAAKPSVSKAAGSKAKATAPPPPPPKKGAQGTQGTPSPKAGPSKTSQPPARRQSKGSEARSAKTKTQKV